MKARAYPSEGENRPGSDDHGGRDAPYQALPDLDRLDRRFSERYQAFVEPGSHIDSKVRELVLLAANASCTLLQPDAVREHIRRALRLGATSAELVAVLELCSVVGVHTLDLGIPMLCSSSAPVGSADEPSEAEAQLKRELISSSRETGWSSFWDSLLHLDASLFELTMRYLEAPWEGGALHPKVMEFVYIAIDSSPTHLYSPGLPVHIERARRWGATDGELIELLRLVAGVGMTRTLTIAVPILAEELAASGRVSGNDRAKPDEAHRLR